MMRLAMLLVMTFVLAGCSGQETPPPDAAKKEKLPLEVTDTPEAALPKAKGKR